MDHTHSHTDAVSTPRIIYTASDFAKTSLLYVQEIGTLKASKPHTSKRNHLSSYLFIIVTGGSGSLRYEGAVHPLTVGDCVFIDCSRPYSHTTSEDLWQISWVHFNGINMPDIYQKYLDNGGCPVFHASDLQSYAASFSMLYNIVSTPSYARDMRINAELANLLSLLMNNSWTQENLHSGEKKSCLEDIKDYLEKNYEEKIALDDLAERYFINKYYMTRIFKEQYGVSIMNYLTGIRITAAKNMLRFTEFTAEEIGIRCGVGDIYYFSRVFRKAEGISIREYRNQWASRKSEDS